MKLGRSEVLGVLIRWIVNVEFLDVLKPAGMPCVADGVEIPRGSFWVPRSSRSRAKAGRTAVRTRAAPITNRVNNLCLVMSVSFQIGLLGPPLLGATGFLLCFFQLPTSRSFR